MSAWWGHLAGVLILLMMATFIGIWIWAWRPRHRRVFAALAEIPLQDNPPAAAERREAIAGPSRAHEAPPSAATGDGGHAP